MSNINTLKYTVAAVVLSLFIPITAEADGHDTFTEPVEAKNPGVTFDLGVDARGDASFGGADEDEFVNIDNVRVNLGIESEYGVGADVSVQYTTDTADNTFDLLDASLFADLTTLPFANEFTPDLIKVGRFLAPQDRAGLADVYGQVAWTSPSVVTKYASENGFGRLDGVAVYGDIAVPVPNFPVTLDYSVGVFQGVENNVGENDNALIAARIGEDFTVQDVDVSLGFALQAQDDAVIKGNDYFGWNIDGTVAKTFSGEAAGTATVSGGYYNYDLDGSAYTPGSDLNEGDGFYVQVAYAIDRAFNVTDSISLSPEPFFRYQKFNFDGANDGEQERFDAGVNFVVNAETNTKLTVNYWHDELQDADDDGVILGLQFVF